MENYEKTTIVKCECYGHLLEHSYDSEDESHYISFWTHGISGEKLSWKRKLLAIWKILRGKENQNFWGVILTKKSAQQISDSINEANGKDLG